MSNEPVALFSALLLSPSPPAPPEQAVSFDLGGGLRFEALVSRQPAGKGEAKPLSLQGNDDGGSAHAGKGDTEPLPEAATSGENEGG